MQDQNWWVFHRRVQLRSEAQVRKLNLLDLEDMWHQFCQSKPVPLFSPIATIFKPRKRVSS